MAKSSRKSRSPTVADPKIVGDSLLSPEQILRVEQLLVRYQLTIARRAPVLLLTLASMLLFTLSLEPFNWSFLGWAALAPWVVAIATATRWRWMLFSSWLGGFLFFAVNLYWLLACGYPGEPGDVALMALAQLALSAYLGLYFLLFAYVVGGLVRRWSSPSSPAQVQPMPSGLLMTYLVPIAWVGTELLRGYVLSGFPWFLLGHSQWMHPALIQVADLGGAYAVSFLLAAANGLIADGMLQPLFLPTRHGPRPNYQVSAAALALLGAVLCTFVYGRFRISQTDMATKPGPLVAVVQGYHPVTLTGRADLQARLDDHLDLSRAAARSRPAPDVVVWPETMIPVSVNDEFIRLTGEPGWVSDVIESGRVVDGMLRQQASRYDMALLVGAISVEPQPAGWLDGQRLTMAHLERTPAGEPGAGNPQLAQFNSAILYQPRRGAASQPDGAPVDKTRYDKHHLVPFGELIPFRRSWPAAFELLRKLTPMTLLQAGEGSRQLVLEARDGHAYRLAAPICYEDVVPQAVRPLVYDADGTKRADLLVNISNDGWFAGTTELRQHWAQAIFRCVENRVPMARSVNCGCSGFVDSAGRPMRVGSRKLGRLEPGERGWLSARLFTDSRCTVYGRAGDLPAFACTALLVVGWAAVMLRRRRARR